MAVRYAIATGSGTDGTVTFNEGTPLPAGYLLLAFAYRNQGSTIPTPSGWTKIDENSVVNANRVAVFVRRSNGSVNSFVGGGSAVTWRSVLLAYESAEATTHDSGVFGANASTSADTSMTTPPVTTSIYGVSVAFLNAGSSAPDRTWMSGFSEAHQSSSLIMIGERIGAPATFTPQVSWAGGVNIKQLTVVHLPLAEPPPPAPEDNLDYFSWDGETMTPLEMLGARSA